MPGTVARWIWTGLQEKYWKVRDTCDMRGGRCIKGHSIGGGGSEGGFGSQIVNGSSLWRPWGAPGWMHVLREMMKGVKTRRECRDDKKDIKEGFFLRRTTHG